MLYRFKNSVKGVITVFVSLMLVAVLSLGTLVLEAGRLQVARTQLSEATASAATSMIADYDASLYERYGLLAIDTDGFTEARCMDYLNFNSDAGAGNLTKLYNIKSVEMTGLYNLTYPSILKRQILSRAKYHVVPQDYSLNVYNMDSFFADMQMKCNYVTQKLNLSANGGAVNGAVSNVNGDMLSALTAMYDTFKDDKHYDDQSKIVLASSTTRLLPSVTGTVESAIPQEDLNSISAMLADANTVIGDSAQLFSDNGYTPQSEIDIAVNVGFIPTLITNLKDVSSVSDFPAQARTLAKNTVKLAQDINTAIEILKSDKEGNILLNSYIAEYFPNRNRLVNGFASPAKGTTANGTMANANFASACVEYVFGGNADETKNQESAYNYIFAIRYISNLYDILQTSNSLNAGNLYSVGAHLAWAGYETSTDLSLLTDYNTAVPFNKGTLVLPVNNPSKVASAFASHDVGNALTALGYYTGNSFKINGTDIFSYRDTLAFALWFVPNSDKMLRVADLIQLEMRYREQHYNNKTATFLMSEQNTYCRIKTTASFNAALPVISMGNSGGPDDAKLQSIKYVGY